jgi:hypothetical protein
LNQLRSGRVLEAVCKKRALQGCSIGHQITIMHGLVIESGHPVPIIDVSVIMTSPDTATHMHIRSQPPDFRDACISASKTAMMVLVIRRCVSWRASARQT